MLEIDTRLGGAPADFEEVAAFLSDVLAPGIESLADEAVRHRTTLEHGWQGESGAGFRDSAGELIEAGDRLGPVAREMGRRVSGLGAALASAQAQLAALRAEALGLELVVRDQKVLSPVLDVANGSGPHLDELMTHHARIRISRDEILAAWHGRLAEEAAAVRANSSYIQGFTEGLLVHGYSAALLGLHAPQMTGRTDLWNDRAVTEAAKYAGCAPLPPGLSVKLPVNAARKLPTGPVTFGLDVYADLHRGESVEQALVSQGGALATSAAVAAMLASVAGGPAGLVLGGLLGLAGGTWMNGAIDNAYASGCGKPSLPAPPTPRPVSVTPARDAAHRGEARIRDESEPPAAPVRRHT